MRVRLAKLLSMRFAAEAVTVLILALLVLGVGYYVSPEPALLQTVSDKPKFGTAMRTTANTHLEPIRPMLLDVLSVLGANTGKVDRSSGLRAGVDAGAGTASASGATVGADADPGVRSTAEADASVSGANADAGVDADGTGDAPTAPPAADDASAAGLPGGVDPFARFAGGAAGRDGMATERAELRRRYGLPASRWANLFSLFTGGAVYQRLAAQLSGLGAYFSWGNDGDAGGASDAVAHTDATAAENGVPPVDANTDADAGADAKGSALGGGSGANGAGMEADNELGEGEGEGDPGVVYNTVIELMYTIHPRVGEYVEQSLQNIWILRMVTGATWVGSGSLAVSVVQFGMLPFRFVYIMRRTDRGAGAFIHFAAIVIGLVLASYWLYKFIKRKCKTWLRSSARGILDYHGNDPAAAAEEEKKEQ